MTISGDLAVVGRVGGREAAWLVREGVEALRELWTSTRGANPQGAAREDGLGGRGGPAGPEPSPSPVEEVRVVVEVETTETTETRETRETTETRETREKGSHDHPGIVPPPPPEEGGGRTTAGIGSPVVDLGTDLC